MKQFSKLYALIALALYRSGVTYQAHTFFNYAKHFLSHILGKPNERECCYFDDSMFLVYFLDALMATEKEEYDKAREYFDSAEFYMKRSTGAMFFNYPQFVLAKYDLMIKLGQLQQAEQFINEGIAYCRERGYRHYENRMISVRDGKEFLCVQERGRGQAGAGESGLHTNCPAKDERECR